MIELNCESPEGLEEENNDNHMVVPALADRLTGSFGTAEPPRRNGHPNLPRRIGRVRGLRTEAILPADVDAVAVSKPCRLLL